MALIATIAAAPALVFARNATVAWGTEPMRLSTTGPQSTLPSFLFMAGGEEGGSIWKGQYDPPYTGGTGKKAPFEVPTSCPEDVFDNASPDLRVPQLPWRLQEDWGCEAMRNRTKADVPVVVLENDVLRAAITPQWGGKVWSLYHKHDKKQLFFANPAHQPGNIGYRKAWSSGGAEWNWAPGRIGHSVFTESPVWTAKMDTELGPLVRVWEYDRLNGTTWQVDILLVGDAMYAHPKVTNPTQTELPGYWWTCVAMPVEAKTRVITPATLAVNNPGCSAWPNSAFIAPGGNASFVGPDFAGCSSEDAGRGTCAWQADMSFLGNIPTANDFFMHIAPGKEPYIAHAQPDGYSVVHSHPKFLNGTKFFQWGFSEFGVYNQDFLSASDYTTTKCNQDAYDPWCKDMVHEGAYTELQVGPARTQMHVFPLAARGAVEWTEWFKAFQADPAKMQDADYSVPLHVVSSWIDSADGMPHDTIAKVDALLERMADVPPRPDQILSKGLPWGAMQEKLLAKLSGKPRVPLAPGCPFPEDTPADDETAPWLELLANGTFSASTLNMTPTNFEVSDGWLTVISKSLADGPETWLHHLFLGTHALEVGNADGARAFFTKSLALKPNVLATRNLATIAPDADAAAKLYESAWSLWTQLSASDPAKFQLGADLAGEMCGWMLLNARFDELAKFLSSLGRSKATTAYLAKDRVLHARAGLAVHMGDYATALPILKGNCFPTYGSERQKLIQLWFEANLLKATAEDNAGAPLSPKQKLRLRKKFRCDGDHTDRRLNDACLCGPPNLGYAY